MVPPAFSSHPCNHVLLCLRSCRTSLLKRKATAVHQEGASGDCGRRPLYMPPFAAAASTAQHSGAECAKAEDSSCCTADAAAVLAEAWCSAADPTQDQQLASAAVINTAAGCNCLGVTAAGFFGMTSTTAQSADTAGNMYAGSDSDTASEAELMCMLEMELQAAAQQATSHQRQRPQAGKILRCSSLPASHQTPAVGRSASNNFSCCRNSGCSSCSAIASPLSSTALAACTPAASMPAGLAPAHARLAQLQTKLMQQVHALQELTRMSGRHAALQRELQVLGNAHQLHWEMTQLTSELQRSVARAYAANSSSGIRGADAALTIYGPDGWGAY